VTFTTPTTTLSPTDPDARSNSPVCSDNVLVLNVNDVGATEYRWRGPAGFSQTVSTTSIERPGFSLAAAGVYIVEMMAGTCVAKTDSTLVESVTVPDFDITYSGVAKFCSGSSKTLQVTPALSSGFNYQWYERTAGLITEATFDNYSANGPGEYYAVVTPDKQGCLPRQTPAVSLLLYDPPVANFQAAESGCVGEEIPFTQLTTGQPGADLVYLWTFGNGINSQEANPSSIYQQAAAFEVTLKASYAGIDACSSTATKTIEVFAVVTPEIVSSAEAMCDGDIVNLSVASAFAEVHWNTNESETGITVTEAGEYSVTTRDLHGCQSYDATTIAQKPVPQLNVTPETQVIAAGQQVQLMASGADEYLWSPGKTLNDSTIANPVAAPAVSTTYVVTGSLTDGCKGTANITLQVSGEMVNIIVPVLFSPNGDDANETLVIQGVENYQDCSLNVFDKRGGRVYGTMGYQNNWDGTFNGAPLPEGVYYYVFGCPNARAVTGTVTIIR
jgi:gliding motility-associated-like protein